jgi:RNA polymerase sigma-70 factor (ECF subfamily)
MAAAVQFDYAMSDRGAPSELDANLQASQELQSRFISDNLRRIFLLIYRIVGNLEKATHWLSRIASNTAIDFLRRHGKVNFCEIETLIEPLSEPSDSPEQAVLRSEHRAYLEEGLAVLTERERTALILRDVEGLPAEEVARQLNCSKATVRSHIANARIKFRRYMERSQRTAGRQS